jgi:NADH-quinone oxidoreductase subunit G
MRSERVSQEQSVTITVNGAKVSAPAGATIMEAIRGQDGVEIPHFCWHPGLSVAGVCRFCMVKIEGVPKLQIACNTQIREGMVVDTVGGDVKEAHKWALEFHLINHPLDCPICDQAGECELQNYYMKVGQYNSQMEEDKVLKPKALDVGDTLVLDTERCILCSRCVRFEDEVTKSSALGIFNRGDRAVIGTYKDRRVTHNYSYNLVDICPVGAFTAKDFRFKCRVWFLKEVESICPGCSTGCNVKVYQNGNTREYFRLKPRENAEVNGHWMCDYGRTMYEHLNVTNRLVAPVARDGRSLAWQDASRLFGEILNGVKGGKSVALVVSPQYTNEEYSLMLDHLEKQLGRVPDVYIWREETEERDSFDGLLFRGDRNPNTAGLAAVLKGKGIASSKECRGLKELASGSVPDLTIVLAPEVEAAYPSLSADLSVLADLPRVVYFGNTQRVQADAFELRVPTLGFTEKDGTWVNYAGKHQVLKANQRILPSVRSLAEFLAVQ